MADHIIRRIRLAHCKRGPDRCAKCREMDQEKICLLQLFSPGTSLAQRRTIQVQDNGEPIWREFEVVKAFDTEAEAREYAVEHGLEDIQL